MFASLGFDSPATSGDELGYRQRGFVRTDLLGVRHIHDVHTDITNNASDKSGDWETGGSVDNASGGQGFAEAVFGNWGTGQTSTGAYASAKPASTGAIKNDWNLGPGADTPPGSTTSSSEGYGTEVRWTASSLGLAKGHTYRVQVMTHDMDQNNAGGWRYQITPGDADMSVTGWQVMALRAAKNVGCDVPATIIDKAVDYVKRSQDRNTWGFRYTPYGNVTLPCTGAGILSLELCHKQFHGSEESINAAQFLWSRIAAMLRPRSPE